MERDRAYGFSWLSEGRPEFNHKMRRKALWVDCWSSPPWMKARHKLTTQSRLQCCAYRIVGSVIRQMSGVAEFYNPSLHRVQHQLDAVRDQRRRQKMAAELYGKEAQLAQPEYRGEAEALACFQGHGNIVTQLEGEAPSRQTRPGAANFRAAANMVEENRNPSHEVVDRIELRQETTSSSKVKLKLVGDLKANLTRHVEANGVLEIREPETLSREEDEQSSVMSEERVNENSGKHLITKELLRKAHWIDCQSTPAWIKAGLDLTCQGGLQCRASYGTTDWSQVTAQGNGSKDMHRAVAAAFAVSQNRLKQTITTDSYTYVKALQMCSRQKDLFKAKRVHDHIIQRGMDKNPHVAVALLNVYIECGALLDARQVFDQLEKTSVITWNKMIAGYAKSNHAECALELFKLMSHKGPDPDEITYLSILKACASPSALAWGKEVHACIRRAGFESDVRVGNALIQMYAKCGCMTESRVVFETMINRNLRTWNVMIGAYAATGNVDDARLLFDRIKRRDLITWNIIIRAYAQNGRGVEAYGLFLEMRREGFEPDAITYLNILNASAGAGTLEWVKEVHGHVSKAGLESDLRVGTALLHMYAKCGSINDAQQVFDRMEKRDVVTWSVMIGGLAQHGCGQEAYRLFVQMRREGFEPDAITFASILSASASAGASEWVKDIHGYARKAGLDSDLRVGAALVHMYAKSGSIDDARRLFDRMEKRDVVTWNAMIGGLAQHGCGHEALALFRKMNAGLVKPDGITFVALLSACCHGGLVDDGRRFFSAMRPEYGIEPEIAHYTCMVDLLGRAGYLEEAERFISAMPIEPNGVTWTALLGACRTYGNVELGERAAEEVFKLDPSDAGGYVLLSNIYAAAGEWDKVSAVRTMMLKRGVRKEPGRSWIEVDKKIHEFVVGDTSHPDAKAIHSYIKQLTERLKAEGYIPDTQLVLQNINEEDKELALCSHSEKLAIAYGLMRIPRGEPIRVTKNLRVCPDCHTATKFISKMTGREIIARDANRFHHFKDGTCSCGDYW